MPFPSSRRRLSSLLSFRVCLHTTLLTSCCELLMCYSRFWRSSPHNGRYNFLFHGSAADHRESKTIPPEPFSWRLRRGTKKKHKRMRGEGQEGEEEGEKNEEESEGYIVNPPPPAPAPPPPPRTHLGMSMRRKRKSYLILRSQRRHKFVTKSCQHQFFLRCLISLSHSHHFYGDSYPPCLDRNLKGGGG